MQIFFDFFFLPHISSSFVKNHLNLSFFGTERASTERHNIRRVGAGPGLTKLGSDRPDNQDKTRLAPSSDSRSHNSISKVVFTHVSTRACAHYFIYFCDEQNTEHLVSCGDHKHFRELCSTQQ